MRSRSRKKETRREPATAAVARWRDSRNGARMSALAGVRAVVTGGASEIGLATARLLTEHGADVAVLTLDPSGVTGPQHGLVADVAEDASVRTAAADILDRIDILVNNAGNGAAGTVVDNPDKQWHRAFDVNVIGVARHPRRDRQHLLDRRHGRAAVPAARRRGVSVIVGGVFNAGLLAAPDAAPPTTTPKRPMICSTSPCACRQSGQRMKAHRHTREATEGGGQLLEYPGRRVSASTGTTSTASQELPVRVAIHTTVLSDKIEAYEAAHHEVPEALTAAIRVGGCTAWTIWRNGTDLFHVIDCDDYAALLAHLSQQPVNTAWQQRMSELLDIAHDYSADEGASAALPVVWQLESLLGHHPSTDIEHCRPGDRISNRTSDRQ